MPDIPRLIPPSDPFHERSGGSDELRGDGFKSTAVLLADVGELTRRLNEAAEAQAEAEQANVANHAMLAALAHELRAPLASILLYAQLLRDDEVVERSDLMRIGNSLERAVLQQTRLIDQLLDEARGSALDVSATNRGGSAQSSPVPRRSLDRPGKVKQYGQLKGVRILVIDDDFSTREAVLEVLELTGACVALAESSADGMIAVETFKPHVIVCDIAMPGEDGYAFMRQLRASEVGGASAIPVMAFTGLASVQDRLDALAAGFQLYLSKPIDIDRLRDSVAHLVELVGSKQPSGARM